MIRKNHARIFTRRPAMSSPVSGQIFARERAWGGGSALKDKTAARRWAKSIANGARVILIVVREDLLFCGGGLVVGLRRGGQFIVARFVDRAAGRRTTRRQFLPKIQMSQNLTYDYLVFDHRDLGHLRATLRTKERINLPDALDQFPPRRGRHGPQGRRG